MAWPDIPAGDGGSLTMNRLGILLAAVLLGATPAAQSAEAQITGDRHDTGVIDGDTLQIGSAAVQLAGIDAPEVGQICTHDERAVRCGMEAGHALQKIVVMASQPVVCRPQGDVAGAAVAACFLGERDLSLTLLEGGYVAALKDAPAAYLAAEKVARAAGLGIWSTVFMPPEAWRAENLAPTEAARAAGLCLFHGHIDGQGRRLYYGPLDAEYDRTGIDVGHGGPLFCSDDEARASGWLHSEGR